jgi:hypothetical protein
MYIAVKSLLQLSLIRSVTSGPALQHISKGEQVKGVILT